jgi:hypothetical protein
MGAEKMRQRKNKNYFVKDLFLTALIATLVLISQIARATEQGTQTHRFKMISTIEYSSKGQNRSQAESFFTVTKKTLDNDMASYTITSEKDNLFSSSGAKSNEVSFVVDRNTRQILSENEQMKFIENVNNQCVGTFKKISKADIGKNWERAFAIKVDGCAFPPQLVFNMKAAGLETKKQGHTIAVRAVSKPFVLNLTETQGKSGQVSCKIATVYLFDSEVEEVYLSVTVFEANTKMNGYAETLRSEVATYRVDTDGKAVDLTGLSKEFEQIVRKVGLSVKPLKVTKKVELPQWVRTDIINTIKATNICAATACEGALNPVVTIFAASSQMIGLQGTGMIIGSGTALTVSKVLVQTVPGIGAMKIAVAPLIGGMGLGTTGAIAGGTAGGIAVAGGGGGGGDDVRAVL